MRPNNNNNNNNNKAIVDIRLGPRCAIPPARPHRLRQEIFRILFALSWHTEWSRLLHDVIGDWMSPFAANATATTLQRWLQRRLPMLLNGPDNPQIALSPCGILSRDSNTVSEGLSSTDWVPDGRCWTRETCLVEGWNSRDLLAFVPLSEGR